MFTRLNQKESFKNLNNSVPQTVGIGQTTLQSCLLFQMLATDPTKKSLKNLKIPSLKQLWSPFHVKWAVPKADTILTTDSTKESFNNLNNSMELNYTSKWSSPDNEQHKRQI